MIPETKIKQEIKSIALCVAGLSFLLISLYVFADKLSLSVLLGTVIGSVASIGNFILNIYTAKFSAKFDPQKSCSHCITLKSNQNISYGSCRICHIIDTANT